MPTDTSTEGSPLDVFDDEQPRSRRGWIIAVVVLVLLVAAYGAAAWYLADRAPRGASVAGVDVGGLSAAQATERLESDLGPAATESVPVVLGDAETTLEPDEAGLELDVDATVERLTGLTFHPVTLYERVFGTTDYRPEIVVDDSALRAETQRVAEALEVAPVEGAIDFEDAEPVVTEAEHGVTVDVDAAVEVVREEWLYGEYPIALPEEDLAPDISNEAVETAMSEIVGPLTRSSVALDVEGRPIELTPEHLTQVAALVPQGEELVLELDPEALGELVLELDPEVRNPATDAQIVLEDGAPTIVPGETGWEVDEEALVASVAQAAVSSTDRTAEVTLREVDPDFTSADAEELGVVEEIAYFSTPFHNDPQRTHNLVTGAAKISNTLIKPDEEFSLIEALGPITAEAGFVSSGVVVDGLETSGMGGGLSQVSTTVFNAAFFAGMDLVQFQPHSHHYPRYPEGREATIYTPSVDLRWRNTTPYGALVQSWVSGGRFHVRLWGTEHFDVTTTTSNRYNFTNPSTVYNTSASCVPNSNPERGFTVTVTRTVSLDGEQVDYNEWTTRYIPWDRVVCGAKPDPDEQRDSDDEDSEESSDSDDD